MVYGSLEKGTKLFFTNFKTRESRNAIAGSLFLIDKFLLFSNVSACTFN